MNIAEYFGTVSNKIEKHPLVKRLYIRSMQISLKRGYVRLMALFVDDSELHVFEYVNSELKKLSYAYHYQTPSGSLIFRYDNEPHYRSLPSFPHHKHVVQEAPSASQEVDLDDVLKEITQLVVRRRRRNDDECQMS